MSVTTVPLRPVSKGGLWLLWIGVAALLAAAVGLAWSQTTVNNFEVVKAGEGPRDRKSGVAVKSGSVRVDIGGRGHNKQKVEQIAKNNIAESNTTSQYKTQ